MSHWFEMMAQRQIDAAVARGDLQGLEGEGRPLDPVRLRETQEDMLFRLMAEGGFIPAEVSVQKEIEAKRAVLAQIDDPEERKAVQRQIALLDLKRNIAMDSRRKFMRD